MIYLDQFGMPAAGGSGGSGVDVSGVTAQPGDVTSGALFVDSGGTLTSGTLPIVSQPTPTVSITSGGLVSAAYTPVAGRVTDTAAKSATLQIPTVTSQYSIMPGADHQLISGTNGMGIYFARGLRVYGDANLVASNIASGVTIFGVTGSHQGGTAASIAAAKVVNYTPERAAFTAVTSVAVSGFSTYDMWGEEVDVSGLNGTYNVTPETQYVTDPGKRVYKHASANYYLYHFYNEDWGEHYWVFASSTTVTEPYSAVFAKSGETMPSGSNSWTNSESEATVTATTTPTTTSFPAQQFALSAADVEDVTSGGVWSFASTSASLSGCDFTPIEGYVHLRDAAKIISPPIAHPGPGVVPSFSLPLHLDIDSPTGHTVTTGSDYELLVQQQRECCRVPSGALSVAVSEQSGTGARTLSFWACNLPTSGWRELIGFGDSLNWSDFDFFIRMGDRYLRPFIKNSDVFDQVSIDLYDIRQTWIHIVLTATADGSATVYVNGVSRGSASLGSAPTYSMTTFVINGDSGQVYYSDVKLYKTALTADQVLALYKQEALYMGKVVR